MDEYSGIEKSTEKKYANLDKKKRPKMKVSGKGIFTLKKIIENRNASVSKRKSSKKNK